MLELAVGCTSLLVLRFCLRSLRWLIRSKSCLVLLRPSFWTARTDSGSFRATSATFLDLVTVSTSGLLTLVSLQDSIGVLLMVLVVAQVLIRVLGLGAGVQKPLLEVSYKKIGYVALVILPVLFLLLRDEIENSAYERSAFYRAVFSAFSDRPILGHGLENFGRVFPQYRPLWHARDLESSLTNSPHSVILGTLATGGIILFVAVVSLFAVSIHRSWKRWKASAEPEVSAVLVCASLAVVAVFSVSVESVPIFVIGFALLGSGLRLENGLASRAGRRGPRASFRRPNRLGLFTAVAVTVFTMIAAFPVIYAEVKLQDGMDALYLDGRPDLAEQILSRVVELRPDEPRYRLQLANSLLYQQKFDRAVEELVNAAKASNFNTIIVLDVNQILLELGREDLVSELTDQAKARDKFAPSL